VGGDATFGDEGRDIVLLGVGSEGNPIKEVGGFFELGVP